MHGLRCKTGQRGRGGHSMQCVCLRERERETQREREKEREFAQYQARLGKCNFH